MVETALNKFLHPVTNQRKLRQLFFEEQGADKSHVIYTLKDRDHEGYPSLYRLYMECNDPTEYSFAVQYLDSWDHWELLCQCTWFKPYITRWRREMEIKYRSQALRNIQKLATDPQSKEFHQANKFLVTSGWKVPETNRRGRPSKAEITKAANEIATENRDTDEDYKRIIQ